MVYPCMFLKIITCLSQTLDVEKDKGKTQARQVRRADTNIIAVDFSVLKKSGEIHTGDCVVCINANCGAAMSHLSLLKEDLHRNETVCIHMLAFTMYMRWSCNKFHILIHIHTFVLVISSIFIS